MSRATTKQSELVRLTKGNGVANFKVDPVWKIDATFKSSLDLCVLLSFLSGNDITIVNLGRFRASFPHMFSIPAKFLHFTCLTLSRLPPMCFFLNLYIYFSCLSVCLSFVSNKNKNGWVLAGSKFSLGTHKPVQESDLSTFWSKGNLI